MEKLSLFSIKLNFDLLRIYFHISFDCIHIQCEKLFLEETLHLDIIYNFVYFIKISVYDL